MRIAIFSESEKAFAEAERMKADGKRAFIRNPHFFNPDSFDSRYDLVIADDEIVLKAFQAKGIKTDTLTKAAPAKAVTEAAKPVDVAVPAPAKPKSVGRPKKK